MPENSGKRSVKSREEGGAALVQAIRKALSFQYNPGGPLSVLHWFDGELSASQWREIEEQLAHLYSRVQRQRRRKQAVENAEVWETHATRWEQ